MQIFRKNLRVISEIFKDGWTNAPTDGPTRAITMDPIRLTKVPRMLKIRVIKKGEKGEAAINVLFSSIIIRGLAKLIPKHYHQFIIRIP